MDQYVFFNFDIFRTFLLSQLHKFQKKYDHIFMLVCISIDRLPSHFCARSLTFLWRNIESWWSEENYVIWGHLAKAKHISKFFSCQGLNTFWATLILFIEKLVFNFRAEFITMNITHKILLHLAVFTGEKICIN